MASNETLMFASMSFSGAEEKEIIEALWEKKIQGDFNCSRSIWISVQKKFQFAVRNQHWKICAVHILAWRGGRRTHTCDIIGDHLATQQDLDHGRFAHE